MPFDKPFFKSALFVTIIAISLLTLQACAERPEPPPEAPTSTPPPAPTPADTRPVIMAFGDSLVAGYGLAQSESFPSRLQQKLESNGYKYRVVNAGVSGDTSAGGVRRIDWAMKQKPEIVIVELGANDGLRGQPTAELKKNLSAIVKQSLDGGAKVILIGMEAPPNLGPDYTKEFRQVYRDVAREFNVPLMPFFLMGVGGIANLNQGDGIHPNAEGVDIIVGNFWKVIEPILIRKD